MAENVSSDFIRGYYQRTAERCLLVAQGAEAPLPKWATAVARSESSTPLSDQFTSMPEQAMPPLDETIPSVPDQAAPPLLDEAILPCGKSDQPQQSDIEPHGRGAAHIVRELARRVSRLALRTTN